MIITGDMSIVITCSSNTSCVISPWCTCACTWPCSWGQHMSDETASFWWSAKHNSASSVETENSWGSETYAGRPSSSTRKCWPSTWLWFCVLPIEPVTTFFSTNALEFLWATIHLNRWVTFSSSLFPHQFPQFPLLALDYNQSTIGKLFLWCTGHILTMSLGFLTKKNSIWLWPRRSNEQIIPAEKTWRNKEN